MTILEALRKITEEIKSWAESKFFNKNNIDTTLSSSSTNPVQNKVINEALSKKAATSDLTSHTNNTSNPHEVTTTQIGAVPTTRTINNKALSANITLSASDVSAVPTTRTINGKALSSNITLSSSDVGALPSTTVIPSKLSDLTADSTHRTVTDTEKATWNAKTSFSGNYNDLTNKPTIPSIAGLATETYVNNKVAGIVDSAPTTLNTLNELAAALGDDPNFATTIATQIGELEDKVGNIDVADQINNAINAATADDFGIYVQASEPTNAVAGDIWIDTANNPTYTAPVIPTITASDNGKVLMVVNGKLQLADLNLSIDANGVVSM